MFSSKMWPPVVFNDQRDSCRVNRCRPEQGNGNGHLWYPIADENNNARHSAAFNELKYPGVNQNDT